MATAGDQLNRSFFSRAVDTVARDLLGRVLVIDTDRGIDRVCSTAADTIYGPDCARRLRRRRLVTVRITEVEAYAGRDDPASHAFRGPTPRTAVMFGPAGHLYTYFVYGMHWCANVVTGADGDASAVLLRAGEVVDGLELARSRRPRARRDQELARGPAGLASVLGFDAASNGTDLCLVGSPLRVHAGQPPPTSKIRIGPRVGVAAGAEMQRRFWIDGDPTVSAFRAWAPRHRPAR